MTSRREKLAKALDSVGALTWRLRLSRLTKSPHLPILTYHSVANIGEDYPFDPNVINASINQFKKQLELIKKYLDEQYVIQGAGNAVSIQLGVVRRGD